MRTAALSVFVLLVAAPAPEASVQDVFRKVDLFGAWAAYCQQDAAPNNPHVRIATPAPREVTEEQDLGPSYALNRYDFLSAERVKADRLSAEAVFQPGRETQERQKLVFLVRKGTRRTLFNQTEGGAVRVKEGIVANHGSSTPLLRKCD